MLLDGFGEGTDRNMVTVRRDVEAPAASVWDVLSDGWLFPSWVVGAARMRAVDEAWPAPGAQLHHSVGGWPLLLSDTTSAEAAEPGRMLRLRARGRPLGEACVEFSLEDRGATCTITMVETLVAGPAHPLVERLTSPLLRARNRETLRRLAAIAEGRTRPGH